MQKLGSSLTAESAQESVCWIAKTQRMRMRRAVQVDRDVWERVVWGVDRMRAEVGRSRQQGPW